MITCRVTALTPEVCETLMAFSRQWEAEGSCYGYRANGREDLEERRIFLAEEDGRPVGYLFGRAFASEGMRSVMPEGTACFEVEELYVVPQRRSQGVGRALFAFAQERLRAGAEYMVLSTAAKNWRAILHFYVDELDMAFWSARLFKKIGGEGG